MQRKEGKEPRSPVRKDEALQHAQLTVRRAWAGHVTDFEDWGGVELDPDPMVIHDLNGQVLFNEFAVMDGGRPVGSVKASASRIIGSPVVTVEFGPRRWDDGAATREAKKRAKKRFPGAQITGTELVCYCYPKIGVRVYMEHADGGSSSIVVDVADYSVLERFGSDELEGATAYSFYEEVAEPAAEERERRWELAERELEAAKAATPKILARAFTAKEMADMRPKLVPVPLYLFDFVPFYSQQVVRFSPRCAPHECFELYGQQTSYYCAVATGQMILDFYRWYYTQDEIAAAMSTTTSGTDNPDQVDGYETLSNNCLDATYDSTAQWSEAKAEIGQNRPLKSGISGHARACAGWKRQNFFLIGQPPKSWLKIYDPWPWNADICQGGKIYWEDWSAINHTNFIYVRHRATPCA